MKIYSQRIWQAAQALGAALTLAALVGCGSDPAATVPKAPNSAALSAASGTAADKGAVATNGVTALKSVFHAGLDSGRDPFFPNSRRGLAKDAQSAPAQSVPLVNYLKLLGIWSGTSRPMALINRRAFAPGEEGDVPIVLPNQSNKGEVHKITIRCLEIRPDSVLIRITGEDDIKELRMAQRK